jgi:GTP-binding protein YchF
MSICAGLVGLPNVGKSTLFNALTKSSIPAENYPFCTIDPHVACTTVPDTRVQDLQKIYQSEKVIPATVEFVDIAGLVKGAASGQGLGNKFLSHIREVDLILHVLRCFEDSNITKSEPVDPLSDFDVISTELIFKDLESLEKRQEKVAQLAKSSKNKPAEKKELEQEHELVNNLISVLNDQDIIKAQNLIAESPASTIPLISTKKFMIIANIAEDEVQDDAYKNNPHYQKLIKQFGQDRVVAISAKLEHELSQLDHEQAQEMADMMGLKKTGLNTIIAQTYHNLGLITFFTCGPKEIHAWPIKQGINIRQASGEIHSDLEKGFICADVFNAQDIIQHTSISKVKEAGKFRTEGQDYIVQDGDVINVKFNV